MPKLKKRAHQRYQCSIPIRVVTDSGDITVTAINISLGGISVEPAEQLPFGKTVTLRFHLPSVQSETEVEATVRWTKDGKAGLQFGSLRVKDVRGLNKLCRSS